MVYYIRGTLELARGRDGGALAAFRAAERLAGHLAAPHYLVPLTRAQLLQALVRIGELESACSYHYLLRHAELRPCR